MRFNRLIPELSVTDVERSLAFYKLLGFEVEYSRPEVGFYFLGLQGTQLMVESVNDHWFTGVLDYPFGRGLNLQIEVDDVSVLIDALVAEGYPLFRPLKESWYRGDGVEFGQLEFLVQDPDGYLLRFIQDIGERTID
jgi:catechol 2,3-dioxygenase-like lactoylglutathione lyase family enzyme